MRTDPTPLEAAFQAQMAQLLAPLQGQMQALLAQLSAAAAAFHPAPGGKAPDTVVIDPAALIQPGPSLILWASEAPAEALPITVASGLPPADLHQEAPALLALAPAPAPDASATPEPLAILLPAAATHPAPAWFACFERQGDAGEGSAT